MEPSQLNLLKDQYNDYFIIEHDIRINVKPFNDEEPDDHGFERLIPEPFLMAGEQVMLEQSALKSLNRLGDLAEELAVYLRIQARKIDSMMRYILLMQDDPARLAVERDALLACVAELPGRILLVSNETGLGVVPMGELTRRYVDEAGWLHQAIAERCQRVVFTVAGLPMLLKGAPL
mgnify:CR=1 FL=1